MICRVCNACGKKSKKSCAVCQRSLKGRVYAVKLTKESVEGPAVDLSSSRNNTPELPTTSTTGTAGKPSTMKSSLIAPSVDSFPASLPSSKFRALIADLIKRKENDAVHFALATTTRASCSNTKSVIFSQWTSVLGLLEPHLRSANIRYARLDGSMTLAKRNEQLTLFRDSPSVTVFLVSLKAGGVGLDLSCACRVYLLDPWWNPSVEQQAVDRIHRLGQKREVTTVRLVIRGSIEENIIALQEKKSTLAKETLMDRDDRKSSSRSAQREVERKRRLADLRSLFREGGGQLPSSMHGGGGGQGGQGDGEEGGGVDRQRWGGRDLKEEEEDATVSIADGTKENPAHIM